MSLVHLIGFLNLYSTISDHDEVQPKIKAEPQASPTILYRTDGFPLLPPIDFDTISPTSGRPLLAAHILGMWGKY